MVVVHAYIRIKPEFRDSAMDAMVKMIAPSRAEEGCITYNFFEDSKEANSFVFVEEWTSREALLDVHFQTSHFEKFAAAMEGWVTESIVIKLFESERGAELL